METLTYSREKKNGPIETRYQKGKPNTRTPTRKSTSQGHLHRYLIWHRSEWASSKAAFSRPNHDPKKNEDKARQSIQSYIEKPEELSIWTDGSKLATNRTLIGTEWISSDRKKHIRRNSFGSSKEAFDAILHGIDQAPEIALCAGRPKARPASLITQ